MKVDTETFYVVANISGGYRNPTFVKDIGTGYTDSWGSPINADRFDTRKGAERFIRKQFPDNRIQYKPMRVRVGGFEKFAEWGLLA